MDVKKAPSRFNRIIPALSLPFAAALVLAVTAHLGAQQPSAAPAVRQVGTVKSIGEGSFALAPDAGGEISVSIQPVTKILRAEPGQTDLKTAEPIPFGEIQPGDRVLVRGKASEDGKSLAATMVVAIKKATIEQKQAREREEWQKRGLGGLVKGVDPATQTINITLPALAGSKPVVIRLTPKTILRRYAPNSVRFDDAKPGKFEEIRAGDQFRGRGKRSVDGSEFEAEEIITGSFRNIAGTVSSVDAGAKTLTIADLATKKTVVVKITADSSMHKLPSMMAEGIAMRLTGSSPSGPPGSGGGPAGNPPGPPGGRPQPGGPPNGGRGLGPGSEGGPRNGPPDFQQMIARLPEAKLADFPTGEAVMIVAMAGADPASATAINLLGGVEPLLRAAPEGSQQMMFSGWSLGGSGAEGGSQ